MKPEIVIALILLVPLAAAMSEVNETMRRHRKPSYKGEGFSWKDHELITEVHLETPKEYFDKLVRMVLASPMHTQPIESFISYRLEFELIQLFKNGKKPIPQPLAPFMNALITKFFIANKKVPFEDYLNSIFDWFNHEFIAWLYKVPQMKEYNLDGHSIESLKFEIAVQVYFHFSAKFQAQFIKLMGKTFWPEEVGDVDMWVMRATEFLEQPVPLYKESFQEYSRTIAYILMMLYKCEFNYGDFAFPERFYAHHADDFPTTTKWVKIIAAREQPEIMWGDRNKYKLPEYFQK